MIEISNAVYEQIRRHGETSYPDECCGILLGVAEGEFRRVSEVVEVDNTTAGPARNSYAIAMFEVVRAMRQARSSGGEVLGFYHSHPDHPPVWSRTDLAEAHWLDCSYVITEVVAGQALKTNAYLLTGSSEEDKRFVEEGIRILP